jgi:hypothetical protein
VSEETVLYHCSCGRVVRLPKVIYQLLPSRITGDRNALSTPNDVIDKPPAALTSSNT